MAPLLKMLRSENKTLEFSGAMLDGLPKYNRNIEKKLVYTIDNYLLMGVPKPYRRMKAKDKKQKAKGKREEVRSKKKRRR